MRVLSLIHISNFRFEGRYFSWPQAKTSVNAGIRQLFYKEHEYKDITLQATLDKTHLRGTMVSKDPDAPLDLVFRGDSLQQQYQVGLGGYIGKVDLQALHLMQEPLTLSLIHIYFFDWDIVISDEREKLLDI